MVNLIWDLMQQRRLDDLESKLESREASGSHDASLRLLALQDRVDRLALVNTAVCELLIQRLGITEAMLRAKIQEVDLRDGIADGKATDRPGPVPCPNCQRPNSARHARCIYCGASLSEATGEGLA